MKNNVIEVNSNQASFSDNLFTFEGAVITYEVSAKLPLDVSKVIHIIIDALCTATNEPNNEKIKNLADILDKINNASNGKREASLLLIRALAVDGLIENSANHAQIERKIVSLIEAGAPDICKYLKVFEKKQTYEKYSMLQSAHSMLCSSLETFRALPDTLEEINKLKPDILKALRPGPGANYLSLYNISLFKGKVETLTDQVSNLVDCLDSSFMTRFENLKSTLSEFEALCLNSPSFLTVQYLNIYIDRLKTGLKQIEANSSDRCKCDLTPRRASPYFAEKRYPLHQVDKYLTICIPMINSGPGVAIAAVVELDCGASESFYLDTNAIQIGDIPPGEFAISFKGLVNNEATSVKMVVQITWQELFGVTKTTIFNLVLLSQNSSIDWHKLDQTDPYSLEVAENTTFVGRAAKVQAIANRLLKSQMTSSYITGQKRVGKTSLAKAVLRHLSNIDRPEKYESLYLEYGEFCGVDAAGTFRTLGEAIYTWLIDFMHLEQPISKPNFDDSLAPLNGLARRLEAQSPNMRFIIVLDEFDEIPPELYRYGPLAEAFFANLRTLASRKNLAFLLVGGEQMPFIIGAQGDQLNKFVREPLDYFSRSNEWTDYLELVTGPAKNTLNWEEPAVSTLFNLTNGHPYFTNHLCAKLFTNAVNERDTEIIAGDVKHALQTLVSELDVNSFAHFWKDGIDAVREQAILVELKRLRVLVALGRALRAGERNISSLRKHIKGLRLKEHEIRPVVDDFCRRDIMKENGDELILTLKLFERWLEDVGITKLISSTLSDELENELEEAEDLAFVKSLELEQVTKTWALYRGQCVTSENLRAWISQVKDFHEQRLLFKLSQHLKFVSIPQISELLKYAHIRVNRKILTTPIRETKIEKRRDLFLTYLDGPGKSGNQYARLYAKENGILLDCVQEPYKLNRFLEDKDGSTERPSAIVLIDDIIGSGRTLSEGLTHFIAKYKNLFQEHEIPLLVIVLYSTQEGEEVVTKILNTYKDINATLDVCEYLGNEVYAFPSEGVGFWKDATERNIAKALCTKLGSGLYKDPLGYASQGLLLTFPDTCPNNTLPIFHRAKSGEKNWNPLFARPVS